MQVALESCRPTIIHKQKDEEDSRWRQRVVPFITYIFGARSRSNADNFPAPPMH